jgi:anaerobic ribonucleoside-triphosphate reductase activating protein
MNILATEFSLKHNALELYLAGCKGPHCPGCHNPETWDFNQGNPITPHILDEIRHKVNAFPDLIKAVWVLGGEPLDQDHKALEELLAFLQGLRPVWLFTRREIDEVPESILRYCSCVKTGRYDANHKVEDYVLHGVQLASANQCIHRVNN